MIQLNARALAGRTVLPNTLIEDSFVTVPALINQLFSMAVPWVEEGVFIRGDGVGKPLGVLNSPATIVSVNPWQLQVNSDVKDMYNMMSRLPPGSQSRAVWVMNTQIMPELGTLNSAEVQSWHPSLAMNMPDMLAGRPVIWNEHASGLGVKGDIMLIDWMYYLIGDRQALSMMASPHEKFSSNQDCHSRGSSASTVPRGLIRQLSRRNVRAARTP